MSSPSDGQDEPAPRIVCAGLACVDMELLSCDTPTTREAITKYSRVRYTAGGSSPQTARALAALSHSVAALYPAGDDVHGRELRAMLHASGVDARPISCGATTALAVLPVFRDGARGCFVSLGANEVVSPDAFVPQSLVHSGLRAFHFGYPHLLPNVQGSALCNMLAQVREAAPSAIISVDVNGAGQADKTVGARVEGIPAPLDAKCEGVLAPALGLVDLLHTNLEEACVISGLADPACTASIQRSDIERIVEWFCVQALEASPSLRTSSCLTVCVTCGRDGVFVGRSGPGRPFVVTHRESYLVKASGMLNTSGAGDSFAAGSLVGMLMERSGTVFGSVDPLLQIGDCGSASALRTIERNGLSGASKTVETVTMSDILANLRDHPRTKSRYVC